MSKLDPLARSRSISVVLLSIVSSFVAVASALLPMA